MIQWSRSGRLAHRQLESNIKATESPQISYGAPEASIEYLASYGETPRC